ncbi:MAG TPA: acetyl-CoA carboxylase biotin carboxyl carrier protein [Gammaproteobacteria bacterium]|mgnify:CR=1 FL=1|jgi:acetyl-CoA carboxylase biotin carboxyl carrier protein|nr:acetyl-CoA carboxylase, biotin carboxyl carrier protein [Acidiferrobacteraceae bacterium]MDP6552153.1 acetyl-CoA carboxylase biotin carboxyl carrier protein [Arenicellales bacterium]MDP6792207.1 acetyl-CoA carboxylase biotin carboxyl carrier protein [Arenicellales bacterium]MDP6919991.1 acetyl-CoA carboxylase biotin carboxyl carrier protein [Arenicellales bacterium]HCX88841.1 acetyl-CoA carboxylase biotin carboxyl carrier protein [Gammaproteobacteria bacterium]|tara:strand:+ start:7976 stop:8461 length:486 start_codon:yes stop_codon:yes gene_type:complete
MDIRKIKKLIEMLEESQLSEIEITEGEESIRLSRSSATPGAPVLAAGLAVPDAPAEVTPAYIPEQETPVAATLTSEPADTAGAVCSPMVGTFYASPNPDSKPYVEIGSRVSVGDTLCMIEAMKIFNHVDAETSGVVQKILKNSGDPVEYGETLFVIEEDGG